MHSQQHRYHSAPRPRWDSTIRRVVTLLALGVAAFGGCSDDDAGGHDAGLDAGALDATPDAAPQRYPIDQTEVTWFPCSLHEGQNDGLAECALTEMPLDWEAPEGATRFILAKRLLAAGGGEAQYWLVSGGPGNSGAIHHAELMEALQRVYPQLDVYTIDQRGTGRSGYLECPDQMSAYSVGGTSIDVTEVEDCVAELQSAYGTELLNSTASTQSAIDMAAYIEGCREDGVPIFIRGLSYGTYLVQRYLQIFPAQVDGIVLEGMMRPPDTLINFSTGQNNAGQDLLEVCSQDTFCASQLGSDPWAFLGEALDGLQSGDCQNVTHHPDWFRWLLPTLMYDHWLNSAVPAVIYRMHRCAPEDGDALAYIINAFSGPGSQLVQYHWSPLMHIHTVLSEIWHHPDFEGLDLEQYLDEVSATTYFDSRGPAYFLSLDPFWPTYEDPEYDDGWPNTDLPMLMMQGRLDPATPYEDALDLADHYNGTHQYWVTFPQGSHHLVTGTPLPSDPENDHCAVQLQVAFLQDPLSAPDTSCVDEVLPIDFRGTPALANELFGTDDFFALGSGAPPPPPTQRPLAISPSFRRAIQSARLRFAQLRALGLAPSRHE